MTTAIHTGRRTVWAAGLLVAAAAGAATAHGLYEVAVAARVPTPIAWLYPLITDGLALVAYAATSRLVDGGRRYAAAIVVLAAGLSGLAQAVYLAGGIAQARAAPVGLRFGVGAWPAVAAALTAHLLHLISIGSTNDSDVATAPRQPPSLAPASNAAPGQPHIPDGVQPSNRIAMPAVVQPARTTAEAGVQPVRTTSRGEPRPVNADGRRSPTAGGAAPARERARQAARSHHARHGRLPTVSELAQIANVARGTAGTVLKDLRADRAALHVVPVNPENRTQP
jgi:hypothetical protein